LETTNDFNITKLTRVEKSQLHWINQHFWI